jgi:predicted Fe-Mo cluster-binding NifX family protein
MKIAISSKGPTLDAELDQRFGRCPYFMVLDPEGTDHEVLDNPHAQLGHGAGIQAARMLIEQGIATVLTGRCGPNASETLAAGNIRLVTGLGGTVRQALEVFADTTGARSLPDDGVSQRSPDSRPGAERRRRGLGRRRGKGSGAGASGNRPAGMGGGPGCE